MILFRIGYNQEDKLEKENFNITKKQRSSVHLKDLRATPDMKTEKQELAPTTNTLATTTTSRMASTGAVVCLNYSFNLICKVFILRFRKKQINMMI
jgi:hypothetical protein